MRSLSIREPPQPLEKGALFHDISLFFRQVVILTVIVVTRAKMDKSITFQ